MHRIEQRQSIDTGQRPPSEAADKGEPQTNVLDAKTISLLPGDAIVLRKVLNMFLNSMDQLITAMQSGSSQADSKQIMIAAHTLKSSSAMVGALNLADLCKEIESVTKKGELAGVECMIQEAAKTAQLAEHEIHSVYLTSETAPSA